MVGTAHPTIAMATTINLEPRTARGARGHRVYLKAMWSAEWERVPYLFAEEVAWRLAPSLPTASLTWRYGRGMRQGEFSLATIARLADKRRLWVKIEIDTHAVTAAEIAAEKGGQAPTPLKWYGSIELDGFAGEGLVQIGVSGGQPVYAPAGDQPILAFGLEYALYQRPIRGATWLDSAGKEQRSEIPFVFNKPNAAGQPDGNRSANRGARSYLFSASVGAGAAQIWTSRTIGEYVCATEVPTGPGGAKQWNELPLDPDTDEVLPDWDTPVIDPEGLKAGELLNVLLPRSRMLSWKIIVFGEDERPYVTPVSLLGSDVATDLGTLKKNNRQINLQASLAADLSPEVVYTIKDSEIGRIDQARVRGARRTSTCTLRYSAADPDKSLDKGWSTTLETEYEAAFSAAATYAGLGTDGKQMANAEVRHTDRLFPVFRRFAVPLLWNQQVSQTDGGTKKAVFLKNSLNDTEVRTLCPRELELAPTLPLMEGFNYQSIGSLSLRTPPTKISDGPHGRLTAFVLFKTPQWAGAGSAPYIQVDAVGSGSAVEQVSVHQDRHWSARVEVAPGDRAVLLHVTGEPQHVLAYSDFSKLPVDEYTGRWDWHDALFTVCLFDDRKAEGVYPKDSDADARVVGMRRELVIEAGDAYKQDYLVPGTVVGIDVATRQPVRCTSGGWIHDDRKLLEARARQVFEYYGQTRRSLVLATPLVNSQVELGAYVVDFGSSASVKSLGTVVSEIVVTIPGGEQDPPPPSIQYTTAFAELETIELLNKRPAIVEPTGRKGALAEARG